MGDRKILTFTFQMVQTTTYLSSSLRLESIRPFGPSSERDTERPPGWSLKLSAALATVTHNLFPLLGLLLPRGTGKLGLPGTPCRPEASC